ncbi:MAG: putative membrane protein [Verrucomicrobiales bacterium]|jgi:uncharacterized membrane protein
MSDHDDSEKDWVYRDSTKKLLMALLLIGCALSVAAELLVPARKGKFGMDGFFGFYAILGFVSCTIMIFVAKLFGLFLKMKTNFYGDDGQEEEGAA